MQAFLVGKLQLWQIFMETLLRSPYMEIFLIRKCIKGLSIQSNCSDHIHCDQIAKLFCQ